ncbi:tetratricopeptide repeat protein [Actinomycetes bacterium M1A6_2h]
MDHDLEAAIAKGFDARDRADMAPTITYFRELLDAHPGNAAVLYELAGSYDTAGDEATAETYYLQAFDAGLSGDRRRRALLQYGSTLRNLGRIDESLSVLARATAEFPESDSLRVFHALSLHASGRYDDALAETLLLIADRLDSDEVRRYEAAIRGNAEYLKKEERSGRS